MKKIFLILFFLLEFFVSNAQDGKLDTTFGYKGMAKCLVGTAGSIALQKDGKIIAGGNSINSKFTLARFYSNGKIDSTFGDNGTVEVRIGISNDNDESIALQADGKIIEGGTCINNSGNWSFALARFDTTGKLDNSFNGNGIVFTSFNTIGASDYGYALNIQHDGKIIQVGFGLDNNLKGYLAMVRYNYNGTIDNSFGIGGKVLTTIGISPFASSVTIQPDGKILVGGTSGTNAPSAFFLVRYNSNGTLDNTFGSSGKVTTFFGLGGSSGGAYDDDEAMGMALQPDGKIILVGQSYLGTDTFTAVALARYNIDGSLDNSFGVKGKVRTQVPNQHIAGAGSGIVQSDGKILISGGCYIISDNETRFLLLRYNPNGTIDNTFGSNGIIIENFDSIPNSAGKIIILSDKDFLVGGGASSAMIQYGFVCRYLYSLDLGVLNFSLKENPVLIYPNPIQSEAMLQYTLTGDESISIVLYDMLGRQVQTFVTNEIRVQGEHKETLHLSPALSAGNYILNISNGKSNQGVKIVKRK